LLDNAPSMSSLCALLGIEHPIIQSGMGRVAGPELAAEVSRAGGLGVLAGLNLAPDDLRAQIRRLRDLTNAPFGVNLWLHPDVESPIDPATLPSHDVAAVNEALNPARRQVGVPESASAPAARPDLLPLALDVVLDERVPVFSCALGYDAKMIARCHERGITVMTMAATVDDARAMASAGADVIVAQGGEAGGHRSVDGKPTAPEHVNVGTIVLVPQIADAVSVPVVAAGGIADGRGLVAALALGASGVLLGTRFVATRESQAAEIYKKRVLESDSTATVVTDTISGLWARALRNRFTDEYRASGAPVFPPHVQRAAASDVYIAALKRQDAEYYPMMTGQSAGLIHDLPGAGDVVEAVVREAQAILERLHRGDRS